MAGHARRRYRANRDDSTQSAMPVGRQPAGRRRVWQQAPKCGPRRGHQYRNGRTALGSWCMARQACRASHARRRGPCAALVSRARCVLRFVVRGHWPGSAWQCAAGRQATVAREVQSRLAVTVTGLPGAALLSRWGHANGSLGSTWRGRLSPKVLVCGRGWLSCVGFAGPMENCRVPFAVWARCVLVWVWFSCRVSGSHRWRFLYG